MRAIMDARRPFGEVGVPTIYRFGPNVFLFHSREHDPPHVHVLSSDAWAWFELEPVRLRRSKGYTQRQLGQLHRIVEDQQVPFLRRWNEHFGR